MATIELNYRDVKNNALYLKKKSKDIIAVVKNNAYNMGLKESIQLFYEAGITYFATTKLEECRVIREVLGNDVKILMLNPTYDFDFARKYNLEINIPSPTYVKENLGELKDLTLQMEFAGSMRRAGARNLEEVFEIIELCQKNNLHLKGLWSHFAFADEFDGVFYEREREIVRNIVKEATKKHDFEVIHLQNSGSFLRDGVFEETTHQRLGIILYGAMPYDIKTEPVSAYFDDLDIAPPITVYAHVINIVELKKGECIGYSNAHIAENDEKVAVVDIGYGDGILRARFKDNTCMINGKEKKIYANMMSHIVIEIDDEVKIGDRVFIYNDKLQSYDYVKYFGSNAVQMAALNYNSLKVKKVY